MLIAVNKNLPLGLKEQIKRQIRLMVDTGALKKGQLLPSAKDLAVLIHVNRNTVSQAYQELARDAVLITRKGSGTFVNAVAQTHDTRRLNAILEDVFSRIKQLGIDEHQAVEYLIAQLMLRTAKRLSDRRILVVDCNEGVIADLSNSLENRLDVKSTGVLIQTLENAAGNHQKLLDGIDVVVCGLHHVEAFHRAVPDCSVDVIGVWLRPHVRVMNEVLKLPPGSRVGYICANQRSTETLFKTQAFSTGSDLVSVFAGLDNPMELQRLLDLCDVIFATHYVHDRVCSLAAPGKRIIKVNLHIDDANIDLVKEVLYALA